MGYTARDNGEFVRNAGKGSAERNHGARKKYDDVDWQRTTALDKTDGFEQVTPKRIKKKYKLQ